MTREQELKLIEIGLNCLLNGSNGTEVKKRVPWNKGVTGYHRKKKTHHKWTDAQRAKFSATMREKWQKHKSK